MLDRTIPFYNTILRCDKYQHREVDLPSGFSIVSYKKGYEKTKIMSRSYREAHPEVNENPTQKPLEPTLQKNQQEPLQCHP